MEGTSIKDVPAELILEIPIGSLSEHRPPLDLSTSATPCRYRLIGCTELVSDNKLSIYEFQNFPSVPYSAISYVWRGNSVDANYPGSAFSVRGAEDGDPLGVEVLHDACQASLMKKARYLWIDRLCIMQMNSEDKHFQIQEMYRIYCSCAVCLVVPGGLRRLVRLDEETTWIHRGWTLQEALAPAVSLVMFAWKLGNAKARGGDNSGEIEEVTPNRSALATLSLIVDACTVGTISISSAESPQNISAEATIFSSQPSARSYKDLPFWRPTRRIMAPNVSALAVAKAEELSQDEREYAIWQSALMRTSSRPVDMVFSIMGLFGVTLDTRKFHKDDRIGATIALAREILQQGGRANWLGASFRAQPCPHLSTFPLFPRTRVAGKALVRGEDGRFREVSQLMENEYPNENVLGHMPQGSMDADGYLSFDAKAVQLEQVLHKSDEDPMEQSSPELSFIKATDETTWRVLSDAETMTPDVPRTFAILLGFFVGYFPGGTPAHDANNVRAMLVQEHDAEKFHVRSYFMLPKKYQARAKQWKLSSFSVGGPEHRAGTEVEEELDEELVESTSYDPALFESSPHKRREPRTLKHMSEHRARWAAPQTYLERPTAPVVDTAMK
ncbi:Ankyrin repeat-containing protein [Mycena sanguinolenta]|uniref:Ankyrin repeat-containing protein n=1 Tax=Mycena sanguinolenta TaxID=230812 RepID=A0A8H6X9I8_9AGAR|nr:Ankyrin repeat-containing protein [Mycena sanguinolenta]